MRYIRFVINNFKGIVSLELDLDRRPKHPVHTLVGLNESGKTTILEALDWFSSPNRYDPNDLVPKRLKANFTGDISVEAHLRLDQSDVVELKDYMEEFDFIADEVGFEISMQRTFQYSASDVHTKTTVWSMPVHGDILESCGSAVEGMRKAAYPSA